MKTMDPNRFTIGERVLYANHVTGEQLGFLEVVAIERDYIICNRLLSRGKPFKFWRDGSATWSSNLSIHHAQIERMTLREFSSKGGKTAQARITKAERSRRALKQWETRKKKSKTK